MSFRTIREVQTHPYYWDFFGHYSHGLFSEPRPIQLLGVVDYHIRFTPLSCSVCHRADRSNCHRRGRVNFIFSQQEQDHFFLHGLFPEDPEQLEDLCLISLFGVEDE